MNTNNTHQEDTMQATVSQDEYVRVSKRPIWALRGPNVNILFQDINQAHRWAETRFGPGEAWTVSEQYVWKVKAES